MALTAEQKQTVAGWIASGDSLSSVQKKLSEQFKLSLTYMEVRFLVDDLGLALKDAPKKAPVAADLSKPAAPDPADADPGLPAEEAVPGALQMDVDAVMRPGTVVSGSVTFSDGQSAKWAVDQYGRLLFEPAQKGYRPSNTDLQEFQMELQSVLERKGLY